MLAPVEPTGCASHSQWPTPGGLLSHKLDSLRFILLIYFPKQCFIVFPFFTVCSLGISPHLFISTLYFLVSCLLISFVFLQIKVRITAIPILSQTNKKEWKAGGTWHFFPVLPNRKIEGYLVSCWIQIYRTGR